MKKYRFLSLLAALYLFSCSSKHVVAPTPPPTPPGVDSLFFWQSMYKIPSQGAEDIWFVSASKGFYAGGDQSLYQSQDSGKTWTNIPNTTAAPSYIQLFFLDDQHGFAQSSSQLLITRDGGSTWATKQLPVHNGLNIFFTTPATGFCGDQSLGLYRTTDTGTTWSAVYSTTGTTFGYYPYFPTPDNGFVMTGSGDLASSGDSGKTWSPGVQNIVTNATGYFTLQFVDAQTGFFAGSNGLLKTTNGGANWTNIYPGHFSLNVVKFFDANSGYYLADAAIYKTVNGGQSWITSCRVANDIFSGMHFISPTKGWACTFGGHILRLNQ